MNCFQIIVSLTSDTTFASVYLNAEESQDVVSKYNQQTNESGEQRRVRGYLDRANAFARNIQSERNAEFSNNKSASNTRRNDSLGSDISRKGRYFDHPSLYVKTQRVDRYGLDEDDIRFRVDSGNSGYTQRVVNCFQIIVSLTSDTTNPDFLIGKGTFSISILMIHIYLTLLTTLYF